MSSPDSTLALAESARRLQLNLRLALLRDVTRAWSLLDFHRMAATWPTWIQVMSALLGRYHASSADQAALFYRAIRQSSIGDPGAPDIVRLADAPAQEWVTKALGYAAPGFYARQTAAGKPSEAAARAAQVQVLGTASRIMLDGGRTTITETTRADPQAVGWFRVTDGDPCGFCALLASRGVVYKESTVDFKTHNDCGCYGSPAFTRDQPLPDVTREAQRVYRNRGDGDALVAFRKAWRARTT